MQSRHFKIFLTADCTDNPLNTPRDKRIIFHSKIEHEQEFARTANYPRYPGNPRFTSAFLRLLAYLANPLLRAAHVGAGAGVDLDGFAFFDEERDVDRLAGLEFCRFSYVTGGITADTLG